MWWRELQQDSGGLWVSRGGWVFFLKVWVFDFYSGDVCSDSWQLLVVNRRLGLGWGDEKRLSSMA